MYTAGLDRSAVTPKTWFIDSRIFYHNCYRAEGYGRLEFVIAKITELDFLPSCFCDVDLAQVSCLKVSLLCLNWAP